MTINPGGPLTIAEARELARLLARYSEHHLDLFDNWLVETTQGPVYVVLDRALAPGGSPEVFSQIWPPRAEAGVEAAP